jgi:hypothetical protein
MLAGSTTSVVEQDVDSAVRFGSLSNGSVHHVFVSDVTGDESSFAAFGSNGSFDRFALIFAASHDDDLRTFFGEQVGGAFADSAVPAGDYGYFAFESIAHR